MGRIWRIRHKDHQPFIEKPQMLEESTAELVRHLQNPIGWWRDTAQKLILLRPDREKSIPLLEGLFRFTQSPLPRMHALWTLDGMNALTTEIKREALADRSPVLLVQWFRSSKPNYLTNSTCFYPWRRSGIPG